MRASAALITAAVLAIAGCSSSSATHAVQGTKLTGQPVRVMTIGTAGPEEGGPVPQIEQMGIAYEGFINHHGGINGRPLKVIFCSDGDTPSGAQQCARTAVSDRVAAVVGGFSIVGGSNILPVLSRANIPWIGEGMFSPAENTSPDSYPIIGSLATQWLALGQAAGHLGCTKAGVLEWNNPVGVYGLQWFERGLQAAGGKVGPTPLVGTSTTDLTSAAAAVTTTGVSCVALLLSPTQGPLAVQALMQAGSKARLLFYPDEVPETAIAQTGGAHSLAEGGLSASWFPAATSPLWSQAKQAVKMYAPNPSVPNFTDDYGTQLTWVAFVAFTSLVKSQHLTTINGPNLRAALARAKNINTGGLTPPLNFHTLVVTGPAAPFYSRVFNPYVTLLTIKNGHYTYLKPGFISMASLL